MPIARAFDFFGGKFPKRGGAISLAASRETSRDGRTVGGPACRLVRNLSMSRAARCARTADDRRP
jgi:hypothetical protein